MRRRNARVREKAYGRGRECVHVSVCTARVVWGPLCACVWVHTCVHMCERKHMGDRQWVHVCVCTAGVV